MKDRLGIALGEASTWRGLVFIVTALGLRLEPEQQDAIVAAGLAIAGLIGVFWQRGR